MVKHNQGEKMPEVINEVKCQLCIDNIGVFDNSNKCCRERHFKMLARVLPREAIKDILNNIKNKREIMDKNMSCFHSPLKLPLVFTALACFDFQQVIHAEAVPCHPAG